VHDAAAYRVAMVLPGVFFLLACVPLSHPAIHQSGMNQFGASNKARARNGAAKLTQHATSLASPAPTSRTVLRDKTYLTVTALRGEAGPHARWSGGGRPRVLILGHHDTVFPLGTLARRPFTVANRRVMGPGVFDMLGGLVQSVHGLAALEDLTGVEILVTCDEENGSHTSRTLIEERARACGAVLVLEGAAEGGGLKTARKGCGTFEVAITGRASHAGLEPEAGVNALIEAAHQIIRIAAMSRPEVGTTVTPTVANGGTQSNVVPATVTVAVDVRIATAGEKDRIETEFAALAPYVHAAQIQVRGGIGRPPMPESAAMGLFAIARRLLPGIEAVAVGGWQRRQFHRRAGRAHPRRPRSRRRRRPRRS
jgi:glutamate carboxypeptidase